MPWFQLFFLPLSRNVRPRIDEARSLHNPISSKVLALTSPLCTISLHALLHCNKLSAKHTGFNCSLFLREPDDRCHIQVNDKTRTRATRQFVPCVIRMNVHAEINVLHGAQEHLEVKPHERHR